MNSEEKIVSLLKEKACTKQKIYRITKNIFANFQDVLQEKANILNNEVQDKDVEVSYEESGDFDAKLKFSGDTLLFHMHSNIFDFDSSHQIHKT
ncbi:MAG: hypothetical protein HOL74_02350, partial [Flavobacteriales bacterium]|nr:hypothetical protein [Flavobacteriales bacterium]